MADKLYKFCTQNESHLIDKWDQYLPVYDRHMKAYENPVILEIGVYHGGSLNMWNHYFDGKCTIYGLDINPNCKQFERDNIHILIGDQGSPSFMEEVKKAIPHIDIIIDDGSHINSHQIMTFEHLYPHLCDNGLYICEDVHTSYWPEYGGGYRRHGTFMEYTKDLMDQLNGHMSRNPSLVTPFTRMTKSIHIYDSMVVFEKGSHDMMNRITRGKRMY